MNSTLTGGVLALAPSACAGYARPTNQKDKRLVWDRPDAPAFKLLPNACIIHSATTTSVILVRVPGDPAGLRPVDALLMDPEYKGCLCTEAGKNFHLRPEYYCGRHERLMDSPAFHGRDKQ
jgi:hypothetical protein